MNAVVSDPAKTVFLTVFPSQRAPLDNKKLHPFASSLTSAFGFFSVQLGGLISALTGTIAFISRI